MDFAQKLARRRLYSHVRSGEAGMPLAGYLAATFSRFDLDGWLGEISAGRIRVNGRVAESGNALQCHDLVEFFPVEQPEPEADLRYRIVYEDADLIVFDKPGNLCVHPSGPFFRNTLWHLAGSRCGELHFVSRLDRETSGLVLAARNARAAAAVDNHHIAMRKEYFALVHGRFRGELRAIGMLEPDTGSLVAKKRRFVPFAEAASEAAECADTELAEVRPVGADRTLVRAIPHTGRQHQIRATLYSLGYPLVGDKLYGLDERIFLKIRTRTVSPEDLARLGMARQALHAARLEFRHPFSGEKICCEAPLPEDFPV